MSPVARRIFLVATALSVGAAVVAACSDSSSPAAGTPDSGGPPVVPGTPDADNTPVNPTPDGGAPGPNDAGGDAEAGSTCPLPGVIGSAECHKCVQAKCCAQVGKCDGIPDCKALFTCVTDCLPKPDAGGCVNGCIDSHPDGSADYTEVDDCVATEPPEGCALDCS